MEQFSGFLLLILGAVLLLQLAGAGHGPGGTQQLKQWWRAKFLGHPT